MEFSALGLMSTQELLSMHSVVLVAFHALLVKLVASEVSETGCLAIASLDSPPFL
jgi:hypothetical protein